MMPVYLDAYETSIARAYKPDSIRKAVAQAFIMDELDTLPDSQGVFTVEKGIEVPPFIHPIQFAVRDGQKRVAVDLRSYINSQGEVSVVNKAEYNLQINRAILTHVWINYPRKYFASVQDTTLRLFVKWISTSVARRFNLNMQDIMIMEVCLATYYLYLFNEDTTIDELGKLNLINRISKALGFPVSFVTGLLENVDTPIDSVEALTIFIRFKTDSVRLKDMNSGVLYTIISRSWFGHNASEILACALEHIPTFYALVYSAISENLYRKTGFAQAVEVVMKKDKLNTQQGIKTLMDLNSDSAGY